MIQICRGWSLVLNKSTIVCIIQSLIDFFFPFTPSMAFGRCIQYYFIFYGFNSIFIRFFFVGRVFPEQSRVVIVAWDFFSFNHLLYLCANSLCLLLYGKILRKIWFFSYILKRGKIWLYWKIVRVGRIFFTLICPKLKITFQSSIRSSSLIN